MLFTVRHADSFNTEDGPQVRVTAETHEEALRAIAHFVNSGLRDHVIVAMRLKEPPVPDHARIEPDLADALKIATDPVQRMTGEAKIDKPRQQELHLGRTHAPRRGRRPGHHRQPPKRSSWPDGAKPIGQP